MNLVYTGLPKIKETPFSRSARGRRQMPRFRGEVCDPRCAHLSELVGTVKPCCALRMRTSEAPIRRREGAGDRRRAPFGALNSLTYAHCRVPRFSSGRRPRQHRGTNLTLWSARMPASCELYTAYHSTDTRGSSARVREGAPPLPSGTAPPRTEQTSRPRTRPHTDAQGERVQCTPKSRWRRRLGNPT